MNNDEGRMVTLSDTNSNAQNIKMENVEIPIWVFSKLSMYPKTPDVSYSEDDDL